MIKKKLIAFLLTACIVLSLTSASIAASGTWQYDCYGWWYSYDGGGYAAGTWEYIDGYWYHFNEYGYMDTGWLLDGAWYYLGPDGSMVTGWQLYNGVWYYLGSDGSMVTGWQEINGSWYYFDEYGRMYNNMYTDEGYFLDENGQWDGLNPDEIPDAPDPATEGNSEEPVSWNFNKIITFTLEQNGWYVARLAIQVNDWKTGEEKWIYTDSCAKGETATVSIDFTPSDTHEPQVNDIRFEIWEFGWHNQQAQDWAEYDWAKKYITRGTVFSPKLEWRDTGWPFDD